MPPPNKPAAQKAFLWQGHQACEGIRQRVTVRILIRVRRKLLIVQTTVQRYLYPSLVATFRKEIHDILTWVSIPSTPCKQHLHLIQGKEQTVVCKFNFQIGQGSGKKSWCGSRSLINICCFAVATLTEGGTVIKDGGRGLLLSLTMRTTGVSSYCQTPTCTKMQYIKIESGCCTTTDSLFKNA